MVEVIIVFFNVLLCMLVPVLFVVFFSNPDGRWRLELFQLSLLFNLFEHIIVSSISDGVDRVR